MDRFSNLTRNLAFTSAEDEKYIEICYFSSNLIAKNSGQYGFSSLCVGLRQYSGDLVRVHALCSWIDISVLLLSWKKAGEVRGKGEWGSG